MNWFASFETFFRFQRFNLGFIFQKLQNQVENDFVSSNSTVVGIAESLANYYMYFVDANLINTEIKRYQKVTREDIKKAAEKYLTKNNRVVLHWVPKGQK